MHGPDGSLVVWLVIWLAGWLVGRGLGLRFQFGRVWIGVFGALLCFAVPVFAVLRLALLCFALIRVGLVWFDLVWLVEWLCIVGWLVACWPDGRLATQLVVVLSHTEAQPRHVNPSQYSLSEPQH